MDGPDPLPSSPPPARYMDAAPVPADASPPTPTSSKGTIRDAKGKRASPRIVIPTARDMPTVRKPAKGLRIPSATSRPLLPAAERKLHMETTGTRSRKGSAAADTRWDGPTDSMIAGREARQFTVANVGNNGRIYLRPSIRPAQQKSPPSNFVFPLTPPGTAGLDVFNKATINIDDGSELTWTPTPGTSPLPREGYRFPEGPDQSRPTNHRRAVSDTTIHESSAVKDSETGALKVVISKPGDETRPRTMEDVDLAHPPVLDINIPSWRLGTPRFSLKGTPLIRGSSYTTTDDMHSSNVSVLNHPPPVPSIPIPLLNSMTSISPNALLSPHLDSLYSAQVGAPRYPSSIPSRPMRPTYMSTHPVIEPTMFDELTFRPTCDDKALVRYSPHTGAVTAATPSRLVAEITSPTFLDYELISDFFLTFRAFLDSQDLLRMLVARLRWAMNRTDETGTVVRVRTFVALRHWILNYFMDDFVIDYGLRITFCNLLNDFVTELSQDAQARNVQLKILAELKKCWRRVCAHYWDGPAFDDGLGPEVVIAPGGIAGHRDPDLDPSFWEKPYPGPPRLDSPLLMDAGAGDAASFYAEVAKAGDVGDSLIPAKRPQTPEHRVIIDAERELGPTSPLSLASLDVVSCSFPSLSTKGTNQVHAHPLGAHPVSSTSVYNQTGPVATTPKTLVGKRVRPGHKRDNSLSDSLRERGSDKVSFKDKEFLMTIPFAGSLVRGNFLPPGQAFVDVATPSQTAGAQRLTTVFRSTSDDMLKDKAPGGAMSANGMRKLIAGVRRAIGSKTQGSLPTQTSLTDITPIGPRGATTNRLPGTAVVPQELPAHEDTRPAVRIDLLGAEVAEDFKKAVREEAVAEAIRRGLPAPSPNSEPIAPGNTDYSVAHMESSTFDSLPQNQRPRAATSTDLTVGSKSILIVDATGAPGRTQPSEHSSVRHSIETLTDTFLPHGGDPTPPNTPPEPSRGGTPRRSSYLFNQHMMPPPVPQEPLPQGLLGRQTLGQGSTTRHMNDIGRSSASTVRRQPPLSGGTFRMHMRNKSSRSQRTLNSSGHRRHASFSSGITPSSLHSFDATTYSEDSVLSHQFDVPMPHPLRVLRRRPGGDLRAATNVNQLDPVTLTRSRSVGSLTTYTESIRDSYDVHRQSSLIEDRDDTANEPVQTRQEQFSVGQLAEKQSKPQLSLFSTHSSKPIMRPSFEAEAKKLAQIPDDDEDDGGIEAALLKLEGKFTKKKPASSSADSGSFSSSDGTFSIKKKDIANSPLISATGRQEKVEHRHLHINAEGTTLDSPADAKPPSPGRAGLNLDLAQRPATGVRSFLSEGSQESYSSIPLLDRGLADDLEKKPAPREWANRSILQGSDDDMGSDDAMIEPLTARPENASRMSFTFIQKTDSMIEIAPRQSTLGKTETQSFLDDDSGNETDLSSELSLDDFHTASADDIYRTSSRFKLPVHPLGSPALTEDKSDSPLGIYQQSRQMSPVKVETARVNADKANLRKPLTLTPETTPTAPHDPALNSPDLRTPTANTPRATLKPDVDNSRRYSVHLPFILAFDSDILAQQFTLIEKDALIEIDWKELIDMTWKHAPNTDSRSWVEFLKNSDAHGVEVVIARFNLMVKWAVSEIVLTQHVEERARCIIKLIHIARHCRRYRNFATLAQLTIALTSSEVERLTRTWALVPDQDLKTLRELEVLVTPMRNFYNLRAEMEMGSDSGCIPFVGIYTHDLLYNAQRSSEIASSPSTPPLINFERCRIAAVVVKTLLRLLEASTRYDFKPIEGITERCLWIGALSNEEIRRRSEGLV